MIILKYIFILMVVVSSVYSFAIYVINESRRIWVPPEVKTRYNQGYYRNETRTYTEPGYWKDSKTECTLIVEKDNKTVPDGYIAQSTMSCGLYGCETVGPKAFGIFYYCQQPAFFAECETTGVDTTIDFPQCCWVCVKEKECDKVEN
ncbi:uncharacterized protein LOC111065594 [Drosophila obscura]|uniref:uncharacterized protein LOC111065594 n=1 Tax=Drosophila obscura TaxID=7282 RepID=UPI001BB10548|nr:uncharacterized protein LOC111065594 [Drosophila obscura]